MNQTRDRWKNFLFETLQATRLSFRRTLTDLGSNYGSWNWPTWTTNSWFFRTSPAPPTHNHMTQFPKTSVMSGWVEEMIP